MKIDEKILLKFLLSFNHEEFSNYEFLEEKTEKNFRELFKDLFKKESKCEYYFDFIEIPRINKRLKERKGTVYLKEYIENIVKNGEKVTTLVFLQNFNVETFSYEEKIVMIYKELNLIYLLELEKDIYKELLGIHESDFITLIKIINHLIADFRIYCYKNTLEKINNENKIILSKLKSINDFSNFLLKYDKEIDKRFYKIMIKYVAKIIMPKSLSYLEVIDENEKKMFYVKATLGITKSFEGKKLPIETGISGYAYKTKSIYYTNDVSKDPYFYNLEEKKEGSAIAIPLILDNEVIGVLTLKFAEPYRITESLIYYLKNISEILTIFFKNHNFMFIDSLTKVYNRNFFKKHIEFKRGRYSIIFADVNNLKYVNDVYGHEVGDKFLKGIANYLKDHLRQIDLIIRYGGDEFLILIPTNDEEVLKKIYERLVNNLDEFMHNFDKKNKVKISDSAGISFGYALNPKNEDFEILLEKADKMVYKNKNKFYRKHIRYRDVKMEQ
ncbi:MAG: sensor domain-containing diguanylate cyclase [Candidatus Woesearchaeota archaeon]